MAYNDLRRGNVTVVDEQGVSREKVRIHTSGGIATLRNGPRPFVEKPGVVNIERVPPFKGKYNWQVTFVNGDIWQVAAGPGCGCGGGR